MKNDIDEAEVRSYLSALEARLEHLPGEQSEEILFGVREHIAEARARGNRQVADVLAALGTPDDVLAGLAAPDAVAPTVHPTAPPRYQSSTLWVVASCILLPFGAFLAGIGWLFGVAGLWMGTRWKTWEKIMGTVMLPGGVVGSIYVMVLPVRQTVSRGIPTPGASDPVVDMFPIVAAVAVICLPILVAIYLLVVGLRRGPAQQ